MPLLRIGTRGSALARAQARRVQTCLHQLGVDTELVIIRTSGDEPRSSRREIVKGLFTKEIEAALLDGDVDVAVHSLKDLLLDQPKGLMLAAFPERADPRDALVTRDGRSVAELATSAQIGTSSLRRRAALLAARPDIRIEPLRGNVPTRVERVDRGELDGAVLAMAGLERLGMAGRGVPLDATVFVPAPGQGALALQTRTDDETTNVIVRRLDQCTVRAQVEAERAALQLLAGGCEVPIGAVCVPERNETMLHVTVYAPDGSQSLSARAVLDSSNPVATGESAARELIAKGAAPLLELARRERPVS